ncbi:hypothetical protein GCM10025878_00600 [Leuconostoc gasicomitatum]|nr:hypothetical protein GCM10025878_00600 [Leuconostoc gasicomitatum]
MNVTTIVVKPLDSKGENPTLTIDIVSYQSKTTMISLVDFYLDDFTTFILFGTPNRLIKLIHC